MKIYDIISEAPNIGPTTTTSGGIIIPQSAASSTPSTSTPTNTGRRKPRTPPKTLQEKLRRIEAIVRKKGIDAYKAERNYDKWFGTPFKLIFRFAGLTAATIELYARLEEIDNIYRTDPDFIQTDDDYNALREMAFGTYQTAILAPIVANLVVKIAKSVLFVNWIKRIGAIASAPVTAGVSVAAMLATEAGVALFQKWITSQEGRDWLANSFFMPAIRGFGKLGNNAADLLSMMYTKATTGTAQTNLDKLQQEPIVPTDPSASKENGKSNRQGQGGQANAPQASAEPGSAATAAYTSDIRKKIGSMIYVGGTVVTDEQGYLDLDTLDMMTVRAARETAISRGQPDPIQGIPQRPGQAKVEIMKPLKSSN